jgi:hypothetical protein
LGRVLVGVRRKRRQPSQWLKKSTGGMGRGVGIQVTRSLRRRGQRTEEAHAVAANSQSCSTQKLLSNLQLLRHWSLTENTLVKGWVRDQGLGTKVWGLKERGRHPCKPYIQVSQQWRD